MGRAEEIFENLKRYGESAIDEFILLRQSEELYLDFKRSADDGKGPRKLHENDRNNLAKAISGFGNSEGGVVVWGVEASPGTDYADVAQAKKAIENVSRFVSWLEGTVSSRTIPAHKCVHHHAIEIGSGRGFVATLIPKSEFAPHQCLFDSKYYMRAGSNFFPVPHAVLAGMFGQRPQPILKPMFFVASVHETHFSPEEKRPSQIETSVHFSIQNSGPVLARNLYSTSTLLVPRKSCHGSLLMMSDDWINRKELGISLTCVSKPDFWLAPDSRTSIFQMQVSLAPPFFDGKLFFRWTCGCDGAPVNVMEFEHGLPDVEQFYREFLGRAPRSVDADRDFISQFFKLGNLENL